MGLPSEPPRTRVTYWAIAISLSAPGIKPIDTSGNRNVVSGAATTWP